MKQRRPIVLAVSIGLVLATVAGVLGVLHAMAPDREAIRADFDDRISRVLAMPADDPVKKDRLIHELLENEDYKMHARALWLKLERLHGPIHQAARADDAARKAVPPFLARCATLDGESPAALRSLDDEARALQDEHGSTRFGPALSEVRTRLATALAAAPPRCAEIDHFRMLQETQKERLAGKYAAALLRIQQEVPKHPKCDMFLARLGVELESLLKSASAAAEKLLAQAHADRQAAPLEKALPDFQGLPDWSRMEATLRQLKRP